MLVLALAGWREAFLVMLALSFATDAADGTVARLTGGTTRFGARLDSWADGVAYSAIAVSLPLLFPKLVAEQWPALLAILLSFLLPGLIGFAKFRRFTSYHTLLVKAAVGVTAVALMVALWGGPGDPLRAAALLAVAAAAEEIAITCVLKAPLSNVGGLLKVWREARRPTP